MASKKEKVWLAEYFICWNQTEAARRAGYKWPNKQGPQKAKKFADQIKDHIKQIQMGADEVLIRLADQARGDIGDFVSIENGVDLANHPKSRIVKKYKKRIYHPRDGDPYEEIEIEMYDAHAPLVDIGKHHAMFTDNFRHGGPDGGPLQIKGLDAAIEEIWGKDESE